MHPRVYEEFERICAQRNITGSVLEVGAVPSPRSLLGMKSLQRAKEKVGVNLDGPHEFKDFKIHRGNGNSMEMFEDDRFDAVLCNATLEHDKFFWKTIAEIKRVTKPGGVGVIGVPGYDYYKLEKLKSVLKSAPLIRKLRRNQYLNLFFTATITFQVHNSPGDFYRFSTQAVRDVFFEDFDQVEVGRIMSPPRIIGAGTKRHRAKSSA